MEQRRIMLAFEMKKKDHKSLKRSEIPGYQMINVFPTLKYERPRILMVLNGIVT